MSGYHGIRLLFFKRLRVRIYIAPSLVHSPLILFGCSIILSYPLVEAICKGTVEGDICLGIIGQGIL